MNRRRRSKGVLFATLLGVVVATAMGLGAAPVMAGNKIEICHVPPGNPDNFHTIKISENAFSAHLAHGDVGGPCDAACAALCDDQNECTIDDTGDCEQYGCPTSPEPIDCNDQNECTADSCAAASGCVNTPRLNEDCDDGQVCSGPDTCNAQGVCQGPGLDNCCLDDSACSQDPCDQASCNLDTNRCGADPVVCNPPDLCTVSECAPDTGACVNTAIVCSDGETCNPTTGDCEATVNILPDGAFELGLTDGPGTFFIDTSYGAWTSSGGNTGVLGMPYVGLPPYEGVEAMHVGASFTSGWVSQSLSTTIGAQYEVSLAVIGWLGGGGVVRATVSNPSTTDLVGDFVAPGGNTWGVQSYTFTATGALTTIELQNISGACTIDDVRITGLP